MNQLLLTPSLLNILAPKITTILSTLTFLIVSGEIFALDIYLSFKKSLVASKLKNPVHLWNLYGSAETGGDCFAYYEDVGT